MGEQMLAYFINCGLFCLHRKILGKFLGEFGLLANSGDECRDVYDTQAV